MIKCMMAAGAAVMALAAGAEPLLTMRLRANDTDTAEIWKANFKEIAAHPGCCDEIWFSTGCGVPDLNWHRARAAVIAEAVKDCRAHGIVPSLQFQATLGHGDEFGTPEMFAMKTWTGWTGWQGLETRYCNCPRQPAFHAYLKEVSKIYAPLGFAGLWIDDDLRIAHHQPSDSYGRRIGCFCETCLKAFNAETGANWTRAALAEAVMKDDALAARWRKFSVDSLCLVAKAVAEVFAAESPATMLALQHASGEESADQVPAVLRTLHEVSGRPVGFRPGGGAYYDDDPNGIIQKSLQAGWFRGRIGDPDWVKTWTPEIESWPRTYYSRSSQGVLVEGFAALMYGMNAVSFFISNGAMEDPALYGRTFWTALASASPALHGYARAIEGCRPVGFAVPGKPSIGVRRLAIPVLSGIGKSYGELTKDECGKNVNAMTSADVQKLREGLDARAGGLPAVVCSPFAGLMQVHVDAQEKLRTVALLNLRIAAQGPVRIRLRALPEGAEKVVWQALCRTPETLPLERTAEGTFVTVPEVGAWTGGYLTVAPGAERPTPNANQLERIRSGFEIYGIVHWGLNTYTDSEWGYGDEDPALLDPDAFDADQIVGACKAGGLKGLVIVAKHHDGFCLWPTKTTAHNISKSPFCGGKGDYVKEMSDACRRAGIRFGVYVSPWDRNSAHYATDKYVEIYHEQIKELLRGGYGDVFEMWFDGANGGDGYYGGACETRKIPKGYYRFSEVFGFVRRLQPSVGIFCGEFDDSDYRWPGNEDGWLFDDSRATMNPRKADEAWIPEPAKFYEHINHGSVTGKFFRIAEADFPQRPGWFYHAVHDGAVKSGEFLLNRYLKSVGNGGTMDIGIAPDRHGRLHANDVASLKRFTDLREHFFAQRVTDPREGFNVVVLREDVSRGERIDGWSFELDGQPVFTGVSVGIKRIRVSEKMLKGEKSAFRVLKSAGAPGEVDVELYRADPELVKAVLSATAVPKGFKPASGATCMAKGDDFMVWRFLHEKTFTSVTLVPDAKDPSGTPIEFTLRFAMQEGKWSAPTKAYRLGNVAANPVPQTVTLDAPVKARYVRIDVKTVLESGKKPALAGLN